MIRILLGVRERRPNACLRLDIKEVWDRCRKLSSVRRRSNANERVCVAGKPMDHRERLTRDDDDPSVKPARNRTRCNQCSYLKIPLEYGYFDAVRSTFSAQRELIFRSERAISPVFLQPEPWERRRGLLAAPVGEKLCDGLNPGALDRSPSQRRL